MPLGQDNCVPYQDCQKNKYKLLIYPVRAMDGNDERAMWGLLGPFQLVAKCNKGIYIIVPLHSIECALNNEHKKGGMNVE